MNYNIFNVIDSWQSIENGRSEGKFKTCLHSQESPYEGKGQVTEEGHGVGGVNDTLWLWNRVCGRDREDLRPMYC